MTGPALQKAGFFVVSVNHCHIDRGAGIGLDSYKLLFQGVKNMPGCKFSTSSIPPMSFQEEQERNRQSAAIMAEERKKFEKAKMGCVLSMFGGLVIAVCGLTTCNADDTHAAAQHVETTPPPAAAYDSLVSSFNEARNEVTYTSYSNGQIWNQSISRQDGSTSYISFPYRNGKKNSEIEWMY